MWYVYILECRDKRFYTGITNDLNRRIKEHKEGKGSRFTKAFGAKRLVYKEKYLTKSKALRREVQIKRLSRQDKLNLIRLALKN